MDFNKDYYKILEIPAAASTEDIRASYRRLAKLHHPDKNPGDAAAEERFKAVAEAYEILSDPIRRHVFDEYNKIAAKVSAEHKVDTDEPRQKTTGRKFRTTSKEYIQTRIYIRGKITVKFWGDSVEVNAAVSQNIKDYKVTPTSTEAIIGESDIYPLSSFFAGFQKEYTESELFRVPIPQPITCVIHTSTGDEHYSLYLHEIRIKSPVISGVTKYEGQSLGTLTADINAHIIKNEEREIITETETPDCSGPTGRHETKTEAGATYVRKEYYHKDCTTYWSMWEAAETQTTSSDTEKQVYQKIQTFSCLQWIGICLVFFYFFIVAHWMIFLLLLAAVFFLVVLMAPLLGRLLRLLIPVFLFLFLFAFVYSLFSPSRALVPKSDQRGDSVITKIVQQGTDSLISHELRWKDYHGQEYMVVIALRASALRRATINHELMDGRYFSERGISSVYSSLEDFDDEILQPVSRAYDSIRSGSNLDEKTNAEMIVSSVQAIPYAVVLDRSCSDDYQDDFITDYLQTCSTADCCIGYTKFGVLSPLEFYGAMRGDCDTRALALYCLLKKEGYGVALLTSEYYRHAMIAVHFHGLENPEAISIAIHNENYLLWETTAKGYRPGVIPRSVSNLKYWNISLLNENK